MKAFTIEGEFEGETLACGVLVYETRRGMLKALKRQGFDVEQKGGAFTRIGFLGRKRKFRVYFCREWLTLDVVAHEFFHVAIEAAAARYGKRKLHERQEEMVTLAGELVRMFWNHSMGLGDEWHIAGTPKLFTTDFEPKKKGRV